MGFEISVNPTILEATAFAVLHLQTIDCSLARLVRKRYPDLVVKILVIEDHQLIRDMLIMVCRQVVPKSSVIGGGSVQEGIALCSREKPDLIFLDLVLPDGDSLDFLSEITAGSPRAKVIVLTSHADEFTVHRAIHANVHGFVDKTDQPMEVFQEAIITVMNGQQYFSSVAQRLKAALQADPEAFSKLLTDREQELLRLFGDGLTNEEIAKQLGLISGTVKSHRRNIMAKLNLHTTPELIRYAVDKGFSHLKKSARVVG